MAIITFILLYSLAAATALHAQQKVGSMVVKTSYLLHIPDVLPAEGYPLLLFLHGSGERGDDIDILKRNGPPSFLDQRKNFPFVVVSPQCPADMNWDTQNLLKILDHIESILPIDKDRVYVTGLSMGGFATWNLAQAAPERFAAIAPICGGGNLDRMCIMRDVPVWAFHGKKDTAVPYEESERLVNRLNEFGSDVVFTLYPDADHDDAWTIAYSDQKLYDWLLSKTRKKPPVQIKDKTLHNYMGRYKYSNEEFMDISYDGKKLYVMSSVANRKLPLVPLSETKFRIEGPLSGDGDVYFDVDKKGIVKGFFVGPCDHTYCPKIQ